MTARHSIKLALGLSLVFFTGCTIDSTLPTLSAAKTPTDFVQVYMQPTRTSRTCFGATLTGTTFCSPVAVAKSGSSYYISDYLNKRVVVTPDPMQPNQFWELGAKRAPLEKVSTAFIGRPVQTVVANGKLFVTDQDNNRVLIWNTVPTEPRPADVVIGQADETGYLPNRGQATTSLSGLVNPSGVVVVGNKLAICEIDSRILIYNTIPTSNGATADFALNYACGTLSTNGTNLTAGADYAPYGVNVWSTFPTSAQAPNIVLGGAAGRDFNKFNRVFSGTWSGTRLYAADWSNRRIVFFDNATATTASASGVLDYGTFTELGVSAIQSVFFDTVENQLWAAVRGGNSLYKYTGTLSSGSHYSDLIGQPNASTFWPNQMSGPKRAPGTVGCNEFFVSDTQVFCSTAEGVVLVYPKDTPNAGALFAIGQPDLSTLCLDPNVASPTTCGPTASQVKNPYGMAMDSAGRFYLADQSNHRVLVFNTTPTSSGASANFVLGQPSLTTGTINNSVDGSKRLSGPTNLSIINNQLYVTDVGNNRVLVFNLPITGNQPSASFAIGQPDLTTYSSGRTAIKLTSPGYVAANDGKLFVADNGNRRILVFNSIPTASGPTANNVIGQADFTTAATGYIGDLNRFSSLGSSFAFFDGNLVVPDQGLQRLMAFDLATLSDGMSAQWKMSGRASTAGLRKDADNLWLMEYGHNGSNRILAIPNEVVQAFKD